MQEVEVYCTATCPFCVMAEQLLMQKKVPFKRIRVDTEPGLRKVMMERAGGRHTVPQIFVGAVHVGGFDDLSALENAGKLDRLLETGVLE